MKGVDYSRDESEEMRQLRRKVAEQEEEIAFLKKATAYFAKPKK
jgi:transposase